MPIDSTPRSDTSWTSPQQEYPGTHKSKGIRSEGTTFGEFLCLATLLAGDGIEKLQQFLATHPVPVGMKNIVSVILGEGGTLGLEISSKESFADRFDDFIESI